MSTESLDGMRPSLVERVRGIIFDPQTEWRRIAGEEPAPLLMSYVIPLAALSALVGFVSTVLYSGFSIDAEIAWTGASAVLHVVSAVLGVAFAAMLINVLAPRFGGEANGVHAGQLAAYAATAMLISGVSVIVPFVAPIFLLAGLIYSIVLLSLGVRALMSLPETKVVAFVMTFLAVAIVAAVIVIATAGPLLSSARAHVTGAAATLVSSQSAPAPEIVQRSDAERAIASLVQTHSRRAVDPARLEEQFPRTLPSGFALQSSSSSAEGGIPRAEGVYRNGDAELKVSIVHLSDAANQAAITALLRVGEPRIDAVGYARTQTIDGRLYFEEASADASRYGVVARGIAVLAEGGVTPDQARAAIETLGVQRLEQMFGS